MIIVIYVPQLKMVKCGCPNNVECYYQPDTEISARKDSPTLEKIATGIYDIMQYTERSLFYETTGFITPAECII